MYVAAQELEMCLALWNTKGLSLLPTLALPKNWLPIVF
jgi:hypothetical protein